MLIDGGIVCNLEMPRFLCLMHKLDVATGSSSPANNCTKGEQEFMDDTLTNYSKEGGLGLPNLMHIVFNEWMINSLCVLFVRFLGE